MNLATAVLVFREGLEGALIIAIMLGYLRKVGRTDHKLSVWAGALSAATAAIGFAVLLGFIGAQFADPAKGIYEGGTSLLAVLMLSYMIFWMSRQARFIKGSLEQSMKESFARGATWGLFGLAFVTVAREGVETALFLSASAFQTSGTATLVGGLAGLAVALGVAWAVYVAGARLNMRTFFKVTTVLLVVFAAAMFRYALHEFDEVGLVPTIIDPIWNTSAIIPEGSTLGSILQGLVGYNPTPSLVEVIGYVGYLLFAVIFLVRPTARPAATPKPSVPVSVQAPVPASAEVEEARRK